MTDPRRSRVIDDHQAAAWIEDGMTVALGLPAPMALVRQLIRRGVKDLTIIDGGWALDMLIAAGCVRRSVTYNASGGFGVAVTPFFRHAVQSGAMSVFECDEGTIVAGLQAAAQGLPFMPWRGGVGTSLPVVNPQIKVFRDPIRGETLLAVPAIKPDIALLHAAAADEFGNVRHTGGAGWLDTAMSKAADRTIVQVERLVPNEEIRANPQATTLASVDAIVAGPYGAHPFASRGFYLQDQDYLRQYLEVATRAVAGDPAGLTAFLDRHCRSPQLLGDYLEQVGIQRLLSLHEGS